MSERTLKILSVEDSQKDFELLNELLLENLERPVSMQRVETKADLNDSLKGEEFEIVICDFKLPGFDAFGALEVVKQINPNIPFICVSGSIGEETAIELLKKGATDYVLKDRPDRLPFAIKRALKEVKARKEKKKATIERRQSERRFKDVFYNNSATLIILDPEDGRIVEANKAAERFYGWSLADLKNMKMGDINVTFSSKELLHQLTRAIKTDKFIYEVRHKKRDGSVVDVRVYTSKFVLKRKTYIQSIIYDITDKKRAEEQIRLLNRAIEQSSVSVMITDPIGNIEYVNPFFTKITGYSTEEVVGLNPRFLNSGMQSKDFYKGMWDTILSGQDWFGELQNKKKNGEKYWESLIISPVTDNAEKTTHFIAIKEDITEQKRILTELISAKEAAEKHEQKILRQNAEIELNKERLESLLKISQTSITSIQELLNFALNEAVRLTKSKIGYIYLYDETTRQFTLNSWSQEVMDECKVLESETVYQLEKTGLWGEAVRQRKPIIENDYPAANPFKKGTPPGHIELKTFLTIPIIFDGKIVAVTGVANKEDGYLDSDVKQLTLLMDSVWKISERVLMIKDLTAAKEKAEESDRLKSAFMANMSHEIRTPMNGILGFTGLLLEPDLSDESKEEFIRLIHQSGERMLNTVNDIIEISKIEAGIVQMNPSIVNLHKEIENLFHFFKPQAQEKGLNLRLEKNIPGAELLTRTDRSKFVSVLTNLIKNAIKYTDNGSITINYRIRDEFIEFCVEDTGIGIPRNRQAAVFNRFEQADIGDTRAFEGSGLGLAIAKSYVEMLDGKIWLESEESAGSKFYFTIPFEPESKTSVIHSNNRNDDKHTVSGNCRILIVEDDEVSAAYLKTIIKDVAREIIRVQTGEEAVAECKKNPDYNIILMDIKMPGMSGFEATRQIRRFNQNVIIIAQTAYALSGDKEKVLEAGCNDYVSKPVKKENLLSLVMKYIQ